jgi:hypothetical protein
MASFGQTNGCIALQAGDLCGGSGGSRRRAACLSVPPLSLLALVLIVAFSVAGSAFAAGLSSTPLALSLVALLGFTSAILAAWVKYGRAVLPARAILSIPSYVFGKAWGLSPDSTRQGGSAMDQDGSQQVINLNGRLLREVFASEQRWGHGPDPTPLAREGAGETWRSLRRR